MNLDAYLADFARSVKNLPIVLARWDEFSPALQAHLADEFALMLSRQAEAVETARAEKRVLGTALRLAVLLGEVFASRREIAERMGFDAADVVLTAKVAETPSAAIDESTPIVGAAEPLALAA
jgi:hypothetical protein